MRRARRHSDPDGGPQRVGGVHGRRSRPGNRDPHLEKTAEHAELGFYKPMRPLIDKTALVEIYNRMMAPPRPKTDATYEQGR